MALTPTLDYTTEDTLLTEAHRTYEKSLTSYAFFKLHNHAISDDLVQETFLKTWRYLVKGGRVDVMKAFLYHVLNNLIVDDDLA
jgi:DNA-directed RNA polymerase specialized sigma24 family protein